VVFFEGAGKLYPNKISRAVDGTYHFESIYCIGLVVGNDHGYTYSITKLEIPTSSTYLIRINSDFTDWEVVKAQ